MRKAGGKRNIPASREIDNNLLRALRPTDFAVIGPLLQECSGKAGDVLFEPGDEVQCAYFPCGPSLVSFVVLLDDGLAVETAIIGREGAAGGIVSRGHLPAYTRAEVQFPGRFLRIATGDLERAKAGSPNIGNLFARYSDCLLAQVFQSVACNAVHTIEQRTAKWLLSSIDRTGNPDVPLKQEQLASMMGVGRSYVSQVLQSLRRRGVLETRRGGVRVLDLDGLGATSCGCHDALRRHFDRVMAGIYPTVGERQGSRGCRAGGIQALR